MAGEKLICANKKAHFDYHIEERYEAGIALAGTEVKALREGRASLKDSYADVQGGELFLVNCHISPYSCGNIQNHDPLRKRKLLLHAREIKRLAGRVTERGYTLIPLRLYFKNGLAKVELGLARGKKQVDRREDIKRREAKREIERAFKTLHRRHP